MLNILLRILHFFGKKFILLLNTPKAAAVVRATSCISTTSVSIRTESNLPCVRICVVIVSKFSSRTFVNMMKVIKTSLRAYEIKERLRLV